MAKYRKDSLYRVTPTVDRQYLDILNLPVENIQGYNTRDIVIENKYDNRPDLLAYDLYGNPKLWWVFAIFNQDKLIDPIVDFTVGLEITVPTSFT